MVEVLLLTAQWLYPYEGSPRPSILNPQMNVGKLWISSDETVGDGDSTTSSRVGVSRQP